MDFYVKVKVTPDGLLDIIHSDEDESKPFTLVKYSGNVGYK